MLKAITMQAVMFLIWGGIYASIADTQRDYPSIFQAWNGIENRPDVDELHRLAQHDLAFAHPYTLLRVVWNISKAQPYSGLATALNPSQLGTARQRKQELLSLNPNLLLLVEIRYRTQDMCRAKTKQMWKTGGRSVISRQSPRIGSKITTANLLSGG